MIMNLKKINKKFLEEFHDKFGIFPLIMKMLILIKRKARHLDSATSKTLIAYDFTEKD